MQCSRICQQGAGSEALQNAQDRVRGSSAWRLNLRSRNPRAFPSAISASDDIPTAPPTFPRTKATASPV
jgi:hypothetical protein